jgi:LemA protein
MANVGSVRYDAENQIGQSLNSLFNLTENYPELNSSGHFNALRADMTHMEEKITAGRRFYNLSVEELYGFSRSFPANMLATLAKIGQYEKFSLGEQREQFSQRVAVSFSA